MARRQSALLDAGYPYLVAEIDGASPATPMRAPTGRAPPIATPSRIRSMSSPTRRRRGVGRALLTALIPACEERGFRQMIAVIGDSASRGSIRLHECTWLRLVGMLKAVGFKHGRWLDSVLMQRPLGEGGVRRLPGT